MAQAEYCLVIVDVQEEFVHARVRLPLVNAITREIDKAREKSCPILVLEYNYSGRTLPSIQRKIGSYPLTAKATKNGDCGGQEVSNTLHRLGWEVSELRIVGVNTDCCVFETACDLVCRGYSVKAVAKACASYHDFAEGIEVCHQNHLHGLDSMHNNGVEIEF